MKILTTLTLNALARIKAGLGTATAGLGGVLTVSTTTAQTGANTTETDLWTYSLPANTLSADGYGVRITGSLSFAANVNNKTWRLYFGSTVVATNALGANGGSTRIGAEVFRTGASAELGMGYTLQSTSLNTLHSTPAEATTGAITIKITGQNGTANAGDIVFRGAMVEFLRAGS
jgi:hypothetical protein